MVSDKQHSLVSPALIGAVLALSLLGEPASSQAGGRKFYPDDPLLREPAPHSVKQIRKRHANEIYDFAVNSFVVPRRLGPVIRHGSRPALDVNTLGDVPDSAWYTNRHFYHRMSLAELKRGPGNASPPSRNGAWKVISAKTDGVTPGFVIEDQNKNRYLLKFDPPDYPELASAADVIGSKFFYALGYNTPENYIVHFHREDLEIVAGVVLSDTTGKKRPLTERLLDEALRTQPKGPGGLYRGMASRFIAGELVGPFTYEGMRTDDPNDTIPHEDRRALRGLYVFASWLNHHDTKPINTMDSLVAEQGLRYLKHYLLDFGGILGSNTVRPKYAWSGHQYTIEGKSTLVQMGTFGFYVPRWARVDYPKIPGVGWFDSGSFDPLTFKPNYPNPAFLLMTPEDAFWAAKQVAAFSDEEIRALVETGEYSDPQAADWITESLIKRRDKIAEAWFAKTLPLDRFKVVDGKLEFEDLAKGRGIGSAREYVVHWSTYDENGTFKPLAQVGTQVPAFGSDTQYLAATIDCSGSDASSPNPIIVYLRRGQTGAEIVGIDR